MLTPEQLAKLPESVVELFIRYDEAVIKDYTTRVAKAGKITNAEKWIEIRAEEMGLLKKFLQAESKKLLKEAKEESLETLLEAYTLANNADYERYKAARLDVDTVMGNDNLREYLEAAIEQTNGELENITGTMGIASGFGGRNRLVSLQDAYIQAMDLAQLQVSSGVMSYQDALKMAIRNMASSGVQRIVYESGSHMYVGSAARRCILTGTNQMARMMNEHICDEFELDLVEITAHMGARPSHKVWQGTICSRSGKSDKYPDLVETTGLGQVDGLCGANCRHNYYGWVEGSPRAYTDEQLRNIDPEPMEIDGKTYTYYEATQKQRRMERQIRITKREAAAYMQVPELQQDLENAKAKLNRQINNYRDFSHKAGIRPKMERTEY